MSRAFRVFGGREAEAAFDRNLQGDPKFAEKLKDIVGLYMSPPEHALVLCRDEKIQVQALGRTQLGLPLKKGRAKTMTHDYKRHGTTTLFAAMSPRRMARFPAPDRPGNVQRKGTAPGLRQLRNAQAYQGQGVAGKASPLPCPFYPDLGLLAQHGLALFPRYHH